MCGLVSTSYVSLQWLVIINLEGDTSEKSLTLLRGLDRRPSLPMSRLYHYPVVMLQQIDFGASSSSNNDGDDDEDDIIKLS